MPTSSTTIVYCEDGIAIAEIGPVCVVIWRDEVTRPRFERQRAALSEVVRKHKPNAGFMCVVEPDVPPPNDELRRASTDMLTSLQAGIRCASGVIEGSGFKAALTRSVLSGITLLVGNRKSPNSYFATVDDAAAWMAKHVAIQPGPFVAAVANLRARLPTTKQASGVHAE